jgi:hypothetical protein
MASRRSHRPRRPTTPAEALVGHWRVRGLEVVRHRPCAGDRAAISVHGCDRSLPRVGEDANGRRWRPQRRPHRIGDPGVTSWQQRARRPAHRSLHATHERISQSSSKSPRTACQLQPRLRTPRALRCRPNMQKPHPREHNSCRSPRRPSYQPPPSRRTDGASLIQSDTRDRDPLLGSSTQAESIRRQPGHWIFTLMPPTARCGSVGGPSP